MAFFLLSHVRAHRLGDVIIVTEPRRGRQSRLEKFVSLVSVVIKELYDMKETMSIYSSVIKSLSIYGCRLVFVR